ncbi:hypothetical protein FNF27_03812 [Cafeteria roenbergensis]|uniref:Uncharacterized protein n=1 Tax=Cafeteria roenbergensis TaxID=33653 RepID=A0A5A8EAV1_CAFRO|nr:hypothetical protein FNF27_03812 [Cafeteria roenbergensis]
MASTSLVSAVLEVHKTAAGDLGALEAALGLATKGSRASDAARSAIAAVLRSVSARADSDVELARDGLAAAFAALCSALCRRYSGAL